MAANGVPLYAMAYGLSGLAAGAFRLKSRLRAALAYVAEQGRGPLAAVLWGKPAQKYAPLFRQAEAHRPILVLESTHPSPLSAYRGFFGSAPFGKVNAFLQAQGQEPIHWELGEN